MQVESEEIL